MIRLQGQATSESFTKPQTKARSYSVERRLRRIAGWCMLCFLFQGQLGATWDREWHAYVGRDWFWIPPHDLIYSCVTGTGLIALGIVITETIRYRQGTPGVDDTSTVPIFRVFHAPLGFVVAGFGALCALVAAPLDNYWHRVLRHRYCSLGSFSYDGSNRSIHRLTRHSLHLCFRDSDRPP